MSSNKLSKYIASVVVKNPDGKIQLIQSPKRPSKFQLEILKASEEYLCKKINEEIKNECICDNRETVTVL